MAGARASTRGGGVQKSGPRGILFVAVVIGVLLGLAIALGFAVWLARQPKPLDIEDIPKSARSSQEQKRPLGGSVVVPERPETKPLVNANPPAPAAPIEMPKAAPAPPASVPAPPPTVSAPSAAPTANADGAAKPRFEYHDILTGRGDAKPKRNAPAATSTGPAKAVWFVQAGAFHSAADADNLKAKLALAGIEARIQTLTAPGASTRLHRVRVGPFDRVEAADRMRKQLVENHFEANVVPDKPTP